MKKITINDILLWENDDYLLVNKPAGISSLDDRDATRACIIQIVRQYQPQAQLCHRLDKETSGVLAIAKHADAYRHLAIQFERRQVQKLYHAVALGIHKFENKKVTLPIAISSKGNARIDSLEGKPAETIFNTLDTYKYHTLVACEPITGRMHQIRIHLACLKAPIVADKMYGGVDIFLSDLKKKFNLKCNTEELPLIQRVALHAYSLQFKGLDEQTIKVTAPYPKDIRALINQLEKNR
ncbi:MAG: RluA family pseudouridine synthase [Cytophagales bacterium]|nr:RluA family pseudouridine synthase [Cytophagales bacterium]MDW8384066.1 RluA family pseudouridine synthase [Flammeovirgaceae bacterium]